MSVFREFWRASPLSGFLFHSTKDCMNYFSYSDNNEGCGNDGEGFVESLTSLLPSEYFPYKLFDSCNGLILLGSSLREHHYYVCNPLTKQCVAIPKAREHVLTGGSALAFDPRDSSHYKIIRFVRARMVSEAEIFSSETKTWIYCKLNLKPPGHIPFFVMLSVYSRGGILYSITDQGTIVSYNIEAPTEVEIVEVPDENYPYGRGVIELCKGVLNYANRNESKLLIWQFDDRHHNNSHSGSKAAGGTSFWTLKHSICMDDWRNIIHSAAEREFEYTRIYIIHPNSDIIFLGNRYMIYSYHLKSNKLELVCRRSVGRELSFHSCCFWPYSQCCVNVLNDFDHPKRKKKVAVWRQITACLFK